MLKERKQHSIYFNRSHQPVSLYISLFSHSLFYIYTFEEIKRFCDFFQMKENKEKALYPVPGLSIYHDCFQFFFYFPDEYECFYFIKFSSRFFLFIVHDMIVFLDEFLTLFKPD